MNEILDLFAPVARSPMGALTLAVCVVIGYTVKNAKAIPNRFIPLIVILLVGPLFFICAGDPALVPYYVSENAVILAAYGIVLGFIAWQLHVHVLRRLEKKLGLFAGGETGDTTTITRPEIRID